MNQTAPLIADTALYLRAKYHLGPIRCYLARYHSIKISEAGVTRIDAKRVPGHHIQMAEVSLLPEQTR